MKNNVFKLFASFIFMFFFINSIYSQNNPPTFTSTSVTSVNDNATYSYTITTNDADGDLVTVTAPTLPSWLSLGSVATVSTLAGSTYGFADGTGTAAQFTNLRGVAVDGSGTVYVADYNNHRIRKITSSGVVTTLAGSGTIGFADGTGTVAQFKYPKGLAVDGSGTVYVADYGNHRIRKITSSGVVTTLAGSGTIGFADGTGTSAQFNSPTGVVVDGSGIVYVADSGNHRIRKITSSGVVTTLAGSTYGFADGTGTAAQFKNPYGVAVDGSGTVYVSDKNNNRIRKITSSGVVTTLAGSGTGGFADGTGTSAQFNSPRGLAVDGSGTVYVGDNMYIRKIIQNTLLTGDAVGQVGTHNVVLNANDGNGGSTNQSFTITVNDVTAPTLSTLSPADNATGVLISSNLVLIFDENVQKGTGNILIKDASDNSTVQTIDVTTSAVSISNTVVSINPATDLLKSKNYYIQIPNTAFTDTASNAYAGIADTTTWSFATVLKIDPTITFTDVTKTYGDANFNLGATSNSTGTISYSIVADGTGIVTLSGSNNQTVSLGSVGTVTIRASLTADADYNAAIKDITLTITAAAVTATTQAASSITTTGAVLNGTLNDGGATTTASFEYGTASDLTGATTAVATPNNISGESGTTAVSLTLTGLTDNTVYYYRVKGTNIQGMVKGTIMSFTTLDGTPPGILSTVPIDNATGITSSDLVITFNENIQKGTGDILIKKTSGGSVVATIAVTNAVISISNATVTLTLGSILTLPSNTALYVEIPNAAFTDMAGNAFPGLSLNTTWNFSTDTVLGLENAIIKGFALYPNPARDMLNITAQEQIKEVKVFNLMGQQVKHQIVNKTKVMVNVNHLPQGTYFVKVTTDKTSKSVKFIKE